jgi:hypothetical protein
VQDIEDSVSPARRSRRRYGAVRRHRRPEHRGQGLGAEPSPCPTRQCG